MLMGNGDYTTRNEYLEGHEIVGEEQNMKMLHADQLIGQRHAYYDVENYVGNP